MLWVAITVFVVVVWTFSSSGESETRMVINAILMDNSTFNARLPNGENIDVKTERKDDDEA